MRLKPGSPALTFFIGVLAGLGPMSTDMYLPAMPAMASYFGASFGEIQATLTAYLFGYAFGQIIYGPISDRRGRRLVLMAGLLAFTAISVISVFLPSVELLILARFLQAITACAPIVLGRAIIRDLYSGDEAARRLALVVAMMGLVPTVAPVFGSLLQVAFGWQSIFVTFALVGGALLGVVWLALPETLREPTREPFSARALVGGFGEVLKNAGFRAYVTMVGFIYAGMFTYFVGSTFVLQQRYGFSELEYGMAFGSSAVVFLIASAVGARLNRQFGGESVLWLGAIMLALGGCGVLVGAVLEGSHFLAFMGPVWIYMVGVGLAFPQCIAGGLTPFGHRAGTASSVIGYFQSTSAAVVVLGVSVVAAGSQIATGLVMAILGLGTLVVFLASRPTRLKMVA